MDLKLAGTNVLVTDATSAIGAAVAQRLATEGAALTVVGQPEEALRSLASQLAAAGAVVASFVQNSDGTIPAAAWAAESAFSAVWLGGVTGLASLSDIVATVDAAADHLAAAGGGSVVVQASAAASWDIPTASPEYSARAAAVTQIARQVGVRRASDGVRANAVCPGGILDGSGSVIDAPDVPLAPPAPASDVADLAVFLMSPLSSYTTSQSIVIDGGASII